MIERLRGYGIVAVFGTLALLLAVASRSFFSFTNAANILDQSSILLIFAATTTICIIAGVFDLSIAAVATASAILTVTAVNLLGPVLGIVAGVGFGALLGLVTGLAITATGVNSFIGTLAASFTYRGLGLILASGGLVAIGDQSAALALQHITEDTYLGLKGVVWIAAAFVVIMGILLAFTIFGKMVYAVGGNRRAAFLAGIRTKRVLVACYTLSGLGAGLAGVLYRRRLARLPRHPNVRPDRQRAEPPWRRYDLPAHDPRPNDLPGRGGRPDLPSLRKDVEPDARTICRPARRNRPDRDEWRAPGEPGPLRTSPGVKELNCRCLPTDR
jgi:ribose/xylose/arabinose/galactoside ABC-type transport system permease subunit